MKGCGFNRYGELGLGHTVTQPTFAPISVPFVASKVVAGPTASFAIDTNGYVYSTSARNIGDFAKVDRIGSVKAIDIATTATDVCVLTPTTVMILPAQMATSQIGSGPSRVFHLPRGEKQFSRISAGTFFITVICSSGAVYSSGLNSYGQLGIGNSDVNATIGVLTRVPIPGVTVHVTAGGCHALALSNAGEVFSWGRNDNGQLGLGHLRDACGPQRVKLTPPRTITAVAAGDFHSFVVTDRNEVLSCGRNNCGQLGIPGVPHLDVFTAVPIPWDGTAATVHHLQCNGGHEQSHTVVVAGHEVYGCGSDGCGQLGLGAERSEAISSSGGGGVSTAAEVTVSQFRKIPVEASPASRLACGWRHTILYQAIPLVMPPVAVGQSTLAGGRSKRTLSDIPVDVCDHIVAYLVVRDALSLSQTCWGWNDTVRHCNGLWETVLLNAFPDTARATTSKRGRVRSSLTRWCSFRPRGVG